MSALDILTTVVVLYFDLQGGHNLELISPNKKLS